MGKFKVLSVAEQGFESDLLTGDQTNSRGAYLSVAVKYDPRPGLSFSPARLIIRQAGGLPDNKHLSEINFSELDLDGLIDVLTEARIFIKEEETIAKLKKG